MAIIEQFTVEEILDIGEKKTSLRMSKAELARRIGVTKQYIGQIKNSPLPSKYIPLLEQNLGIEIKQEKDADCVEIDYYPDIYASCGTGCIVFDESKEFGYKKFKTQADLTAALEKLYLKKLMPLCQKCRKGRLQCQSRQ